MPQGAKRRLVRARALRGIGKQSQTVRNDAPPQHLSAAYLRCSVATRRGSLAVEGGPRRLLRQEKRARASSSKRRVVFPCVSRVVGARSVDSAAIRSPPSASVSPREEFRFPAELTHSFTWEKGTSLSRRPLICFVAHFFSHLVLYIAG